MGEHEKVRPDLGFDDDQSGGPDSLISKEHEWKKVEGKKADVVSRKIFKCHLLAGSRADGQVALGSRVCFFDFVDQCLR